MKKRKALGYFLVSLGAINIILCVVLCGLSQYGFYISKMYVSLDQIGRCVAFLGFLLWCTGFLVSTSHKEDTNNER